MRKVAALLVCSMVFLAPAAFADSTTVQCSGGVITAKPAILKRVNERFHQVQLSFGETNSQAPDSMLSLQVGSIECWCAPPRRGGPSPCPSGNDEVFSTEPETGTEATGINTVVLLRASSRCGRFIDRYYTLNLTCSDTAGTETTDLQVTVPAKEKLR